MEKEPEVFEGIDMDKMLDMYSSTREKRKGISTEDKQKLLEEYIKGQFKEDIATLTSLAIKVYSYLGMYYFNTTIDSTKKLIETFDKLDKDMF